MLGGVEHPPSMTPRPIMDLPSSGRRLTFCLGGDGALRRAAIGPLFTLLVAVGLAGCSGNDDAAVSVTDKVFAGLDGAVVNEVLDSRVAKERVAGDEPAVAAARYQGMVRNFIACRAALSSYQKWLATGVAPELPDQPVPLYPAPTAVDMDKDIDQLKRDLASGDISLLRDRLTNPSGCGNWIPARPGDEDGPTIADTVNGTQ